MSLLFSCETFKFLLGLMGLHNKQSDQANAHRDCHTNLKLGECVEKRLEALAGQRETHALHFILYSSSELQYFVYSESDQLYISVGIGARICSTRLPEKEVVRTVH